MGKVVGKAELSRALKWSRSRLDLRIESDPNFPFLKRGYGHGVNASAFDLDQVMRYLGGFAEASGGSSVDPSLPDDGENLRNSAEAAGGAFDVREKTARQRRETAQADLLENKVRQNCAALVERSELEMVMATLTTRLADGLDSLPAMIAERLGLTADVIESIRPLTDDLRDTMHDDLRPLYQGA